MCNQKDIFDTVQAWVRRATTAENELAQAEVVLDKLRQENEELRTALRIAEGGKHE
jgi:hypothetical protein